MTPELLKTEADNCDAQSGLSPAPLLGATNRLVKKPCCYFYFVGWDCWSLGLHFCPTMPNLEIHVPFGFVRIGMCSTFAFDYEGREFSDARTFGYEWKPAKAPNDGAEARDL